MPRKMREEDFEYASNTAVIKELREQFITKLHGGGDKASALYGSLDSLTAKYLTDVKQAREGMGGRLTKHEAKQIADDFHMLAVHILAGLYNLYDRVLPDVSNNLIEEMVKDCAVQKEMMRRANFLISFGQFSGIWMENFFHRAWNFRMHSNGIGYIFALAEAFIIAAEGPGDKAWLTEDDVKEIDARVRKWSPRLREDLEKILG